MYLTGGTALSRHYLHHRFSDDLDLFVDNDQQFPLYVEQVFDALEREQTKSGFAVDHSKKIKRESFAQIFVMKENGVRLKIDVVNDISTHFGEFVMHSSLGRVDSWRNILSNKRDIVYAKIGIIKRCLKRIAQTTELDPAALDDFDKQDIFVLNLQRAAQAAIDLAAHITASEGLGVPQ